MIRFIRQFDPHDIRLLIFDLDGTLIDSRLDLVHSVNAMLREFGRPELPGDRIATYVGDGAPMLVRRALAGIESNGPQSATIANAQSAGPALSKQAKAELAEVPNPADEQLFRSALEYFLAYYRIHKLDHTVVYKGIPEALAQIATPRNGVQRQMTVLSNKPVNPSRDIVRALGLGDFFVRVYGGNSFPTKKPDPLGVQTILQETGVAASESLMIGDSAIDILTGRNAGLWTCGVTYGFAPQTLQEVPPDVLIEKPAELEELFRCGFDL